ncbi:transglycosylase SLT domain-containing protein [Oligoflexaceae bacterium]|nr:transglycosylase SLT domain-containing protein [Oligoflexaceae bacterium]
MVKFPTKLLLTLSTITLALPSCKIRERESLPLTDSSQLELVSTSSEKQDEVEEVKKANFMSEDVWALDESDQFCVDDVYGKYLRDEYFNSTEDRSKKYKSRRSRNLYKVRRDIAASHYAKDILLGRPENYYGDIPIVMNEEVEYWLQYFKTKGRLTFLKWLIRGASIAEIVEPVMQKEKLPSELFFLAMIESGFNFTARSHAKAKGPWQFMKGTGDLYGLHVSYWVDERNDPVKSTIAAATFLKKLYKQFGDWYLAIAAYNAGPGKVRRAIRKTGSRDFWTIAKTKYLRIETKQYVPKLLAAVILANNRDSHGFQFKPSDVVKFPKHFVTFDRAVKLTEISSITGISSKQLKRWNPELIRSIVPPNKNGNHRYRLRVPEDIKTTIEAKKTELSYLDIRDVKLHKIRRGDTLYGIARRYKVRMKALKSINPNLSAKRLRLGKNIAVPIPDVVVIKKQKG